MKYIICDIDGTIADSTHRSHHIRLEVGKKLTCPAGNNGVIVDAFYQDDPTGSDYLVRWNDEPRAVRVSHFEISGWAIDWDAWDADSIHDTPIHANVYLLNAMRNALQDDRIRVMFLTARSESSRDLTTAWLLDHGLLHAGDELIMRGRGDVRRDTTLKVEILKERLARGDEFLFALEDRGSVAAAMRGLGIFVLHCAGYE